MQAVWRYIHEHFLACAAATCALVIFAMVLADLLVVPHDDPNIGLGLVLLLFGLPGSALGIAALAQAILRPMRGEPTAGAPLVMAVLALLVCGVAVIDVRLIQAVLAAILRGAGWTTHADCWRNYPDWQWGRYCGRP